MSSSGARTALQEAFTLHVGDCVEVMRTLDACSVDAVVTDPPYGLEFMGKEWDGADGFRRSLNIADVERDSAFGRSSRTSPEYRAGELFERWCELWAREAFRVLKPGGHLAAFGGPRTYHRFACGIEDAGFEVRASLLWLFGSGFPKSLDVSKAIDKAAGAEREIVGMGAAACAYIERGEACPGHGDAGQSQGGATVHAPRTLAATDAARQWEGWGTALKPAYEPIVLARKPLVGTVAANVQRYGTGGLNIDGCRIESGGEHKRPYQPTNGARTVYGAQSGFDPTNAEGRWPANVLLDEEAAALLDQQTGELVSGFMAAGTEREGIGYHGGLGDTVRNDTHGDRGGASRFFYTAKTSRSEREAGLEEIEPSLRNGGRQAEHDTPGLRRNERRNDHPTVKPVDLMRWLCRLVTPPGGTILDPFAGSFSTGLAALDEGFRFIGIEREARYVEIGRERMRYRHLIEPRAVEPAEEIPQGRLF